MITYTYAAWTPVKSIVCGFVPSGEWLGSAANEGRAKLRYYFGETQGVLDPKVTEWDFLDLGLIWKIG